MFKMSKIGKIVNAARIKKHREKNRRHATLQCKHDQILI